MPNTFISKIKSQQAKIGVVGMGYVGLPLVLGFVEKGFHSVGIDIDENKITAVRAGKSYIKHIPSERVTKAQQSNKFTVTTEFKQVKELDAIIICVPTPLGRHNEPDMSYIIEATRSLVPHLKAGQLLSLESTTYPGTTDELVMPLIENSGYQVGKDIFLVFSPEREDPGNSRFHTQNTPKVVGGITSDCLKAGVALYSQITEKVVPVSNAKTAEMAKLLENIYRAVNIGLVNELKIVADAMGIDIWEVIDAAATKPFGFTPFYPGPGLGGHCIPIDPFYLTWKAREYGLHTRFIELAGEINTAMPSWVISKIASALNQRGLAVKGAKILVLGVAYKKNIDDMRESPSIKLLELLHKKGAAVAYSDPYVPILKKSSHNAIELASVAFTAKSIESYDCVVISTDHDAFDYQLIGSAAKLIIDARGRFRDSAAHIIKA